MSGKVINTPPLDFPAITLLSQAILELNDLSLPDEALFDRLTASCAPLIPHTSMWIACSDTSERAISSYFGPWASQAIELGPAFGRNVESHPQFMALCMGKAAPVDAVSDYVSKRHWRSTGMFSEVIREADAIDQLSCSRPLNENLTFSIVVNRDHWGFTDQERTILSLLTPHVIQAWRTRTLLGTIPRETASLDESHPDFRCKLIADSLGNVVEAPDSVMHWLRTAFDDSSAVLSNTLPEILRGWVREMFLPEGKTSPSAAALDLTLRIRSAKGIPLQVTLAPGTRYGLHVLAFSRHLKKAETEILKLKTLGLSSRQAEALYWVSKGKTNDEIAAILGISLFTVKAHLRAIFPILMVENRNAATAIVWRVLQAHGMQDGLSLGKDPTGSPPSERSVCPPGRPPHS